MGVLQQGGGTLGKGTRTSSTGGRVTGTSHAPTHSRQEIVSAAAQAVSHLMRKVATIWSLSNHHKLSAGCNQSSGKVRKSRRPGSGATSPGWAVPPSLGTVS